MSRLEEAIRDYKIIKTRYLSDPHHDMGFNDIDRMIEDIDIIIDGGDEDETTDEDSREGE